VRPTRPPGRRRAIDGHGAGHDPASSISLNDVSATEGAGAQARFTISVSPVNSQPLTFTYATANETATAGLDYLAKSGSVTVPPLTASVTLDVGVLPDFLLEPSETFTLTLTPTSARATMARGTGRATIADTPPPTFRGDFNGDGKPDIVWRHATSGDNHLWYLDHVTLTGQAALPPVTDPAWLIVATGDFNADGHTDLIWRNAVTGDNAVWFLQGATLVLNQALFPTVSDLNWQIVAAADINRDGKPDLIWRNRVTGYNAVWFLDGITYVSEALLDPVTNLAWQIVAAGDFNGDGKADLVWRNTTTGSNVVWYLDGTTFLAQAWLPPLADTSWEPGMAADLDGNGTLDLVWRRPTTGENVVWYLDGVTLLSQAALPPLAGADWHIQRDRR
jgi:hypothetical protein